MNQIFVETRMFRLSDGEEVMTLAFFFLIQYRSVTDGQTDISSLAIPPVCIACYALILSEQQSTCPFYALNVLYRNNKPVGDMVSSLV